MWAPAQLHHHSSDTASIKDENLTTTTHMTSERTCNPVVGALYPDVMEEKG